MKKAIMILMILCMVIILANCTDEQDMITSAAPQYTPVHRNIIADQIDSFYFSDGQVGEYSYSVSHDDLIARAELFNDNKPPTVITENWSEDKWNAFVNDLMSCSVGDWQERYTSDYLGHYYWSLTLTGDFTTLEINGYEAWPEEWDAFYPLLNKYFNSTPQTTPKPYPPPEPAEFITEAPLPAPNLNVWYDWEKSGAYTNNPNRGYLYYCEEEDLLIRIEQQESSGVLVTSRLDGTERYVLDTFDDDTMNYVDGYTSVNYFGGWIYYAKTGGIWKARPDGTQRELFASMYTSEVRDMLIYDGELYYISYPIFYVGIDGKGKHMIQVDGDPTAFYYVNSEGICYGENSYEFCIYKYSFYTSKTEQLANNANFNTVLVYGETLYCDGYPYGKGVFGDDADYYYLFGNYLFYLDSNDTFPTICALDINTRQSYSLFKLPEMYYTDFYMSENSIFLYSGSMEDPVFRITFENDTAKLWKLNGLAG